MGPSLDTITLHYTTVRKQAIQFNQHTYVLISDVITKLLSSINRYPGKSRRRRRLPEIQGVEVVYIVERLEK